MVLAAALGACGGEAPISDAAVDAPPCRDASDCDDGQFCNGAEACAPGDPAADARGCVAGARPCEGPCDEVTRACVDPCPDRDGDGERDAACGGTDCDDADPQRFAGNVERCDPAGRDEDCDPATFGERDADGDGAFDAACCNSDVCGTDCDDQQPNAHPGEAEECDTLDNDCDGAVDEGVLGRFVPDVDGDGYGSAAAGAEERLACFAPTGFSARATDCDDDDASANPGLPEVCDAEGRDDDCDGVANPDCACVGDDARACQDGEGAPLGGECAAGVQRCEAGAWSACTVQPRNEVCDGANDEDCDGVVDEELTIACWPDFDNDGFAGSAAAPVDVCPAAARPHTEGCPSGTTHRDPALAGQADCDDRRGASRPTAPERAGNEIDDDCDGSIDE